MKSLIYTLDIINIIPLLLLTLNLGSSSKFVPRELMHELYNLIPFGTHVAVYIMNICTNVTAEIQKYLHLSQIFILYMKIMSGL